MTKKPKNLSTGPAPLPNPVSEPNASFPVVGLGASAGGLAALQHFFQAMPPTSGMAFVVVVHLAPDYESHLAELLQATTIMPVHQVTELMALVPNHVYVIPPNRNLATIDTHLRVSPLETDRRARAPIDHFFRTLASTHGPLAIGIVLSGTGSDGALGLGRIKELGGLTLAQAPTDAEYDSMPQSALATGQLDLVLPVAAMPAQLLAYQQRTTEPALEALPTDDLNEVLPKILTQVRVRTGQDFTQYKLATLLRRIQRRMQVQGLDTMPAYLDFLRAHPAEVQLLFRDFLISVTNFFRDPHVFDHLEQTVIPALFAGKSSTDAVRIWVVGCATGEEAYSLAMLLLEYARQLDQPPSVQIFATDLNEAALQRARTGFYPETIAEDVSAERLTRFLSSCRRATASARKCAI